MWKRLLNSSKYFGMRYRGGNKGMGFLFDEDNLVLALMKGRDEEVKYPGFFHTGFAQLDEARVDEIYQRLIGDGFKAAPPEHSHCYTFYVDAPGGFMVEVLA